MKRALTMLALVLAFSAFGEEAKKAEPKKEEKTAKAQPAPQPPLQSVQQSPSAGDSPLVQAAKRSNRLGRKPTSAVITNATLSKSSGHITTTTAQAPIVMPPKSEPSAYEKAETEKKKTEARRQAQLDSAAKKKADEEKKKAERMERMYEEGYDGGEDDADALPGQAPPPPQE